MKKSFQTIILLSVVTALVFSLGTPAYAAGTKDFEYTLNEKNEATITAYNGDSTLLTIPDMIDDYPVIVIGNLAFAGNENLCRVNIPLSVREIGINPFAGCCNLRRIYVSPRHEVFSTDRGVLFNKADKKLISISPQMWSSYAVPDGVEIIGEKAFSGDFKLEEVVIPPSVKTIEAGAFENCTSLRTLQLPQALTSIGDYTFKNCSAMEGLQLPEMLTSIGSGAFAECSSLTEIVLPSSVKKLGSEAFRNCTELWNVNMIACSLSGLGASAFEGCSSIESIAVPGSVREVPVGLCSGCTALEHVHIEKGIVSIGSNAFSGCENLKDVMLHDGLKSIGHLAFSDCTNLYEIELPDSISTIQPDSFSGCCDLRLTLNRDTYNEKFAIDNGIYYIFPDSYDWLKSTIKIGDTVTFGRYEQDNDAADGEEDIEWTVLDIDEAAGRVLILSRYALDCRQYNAEKTAITWENCSMRQWLNDDFYSTAFSADEQAMVETTYVTAGRNPYFRTEPGKDTNDKVFLLSIEEAYRYFQSNEARKCEATAYAKANGAYVDSGTKCSWWWLRSPGRLKSHASGVNNDGSVGDSGNGVSSSNDVVRPALWIKYIF